MDKFKEAAKLFRQLADLFDGMEGPAAPVVQSEADPAWSNYDRMAEVTPKLKWVNFVLQLEAPIGRPKAQRIIDRVAPSPMAKRQIQVQMGPGSKGTKTFVVAFKLRCTDNHGDAEETAQAIANKINQRGADKRARAKVSRVLAVA